MGKPPVVEIGSKYGKLLVLSYVGKDKYTNRLYSCLCDCGATATIRGSGMSSGELTTCGARLHWKPIANKENMKGRVTHGDSYSQEYRTWCHMKDRCLNPQCVDWHRYGGRGITICQEWIDSYHAFLMDVGRRPTPQHSIDRINNNGNYEPGNVRWATPCQQSNNRRPCRKKGAA